MKKISLYIFLILMWCNTSLAENFLKLKTLNEFIYGKDSADFVCYIKDKNIVKFRFNFLNKTVNEIKKNIFEYDEGVKASLKQTLKFDKSSSNNLINFVKINKKDGKNNYGFHSFNLKNLKLTLKAFKVEQLGIYDVKESHINESIKKNEAFKILKNFKMETRYQGVFDCAIYWEDQLIEKKDSFFIEILKEASKLSKMKRCKGIGKLGPGDPSLNWTNCIGYKNMKNEVYIGEFIDGSYSGQGIILNFGTEIVVGYFNNDEPNGEITFFLSPKHYVKTVENPNDRKNSIITAVFNNGQITTQPKFTDFKFR